MSACMFFRHKDGPETKYSNILQAIQNLITEMKDGYQFVKYRILLLA